jgi:integrase
MARQAVDYALSSKTARLKLPPRKKAYYRQIAIRLTLGYYRKDGSNGKWERRELLDGAYKPRIIGEADDYSRADGGDVLTFEQAMKVASGEAPATGAPITVATALDVYLTALAARSEHATEARQRAEKHILPTLGRYRVDRLTKTQIEAWRDSMVKDDPDDPDAKRRSQDSANRVLTILKAALNMAFADEANHIPSDNAWRKVKAFRNVEAAREDHFEAVQVRTLIAKAATFDKTFANLLKAGYLTGMRYGELAALDVKDFDADRALLMVRKGKTGARVVSLTAEAVQFFKRLTAKRPPNAILLPRADGDRWGKSEQARPFNRAAALAALPSSASFYALQFSMSFASCLIAPSE